jgi:hypothetical protein
MDDGASLTAWWGLAFGYAKVPYPLWGGPGWGPCRTAKLGRKSLLFLKKKKQKDFYSQQLQYSSHRAP